MTVDRIYEVYIFVKGWKLGQRQGLEMPERGEGGRMTAFFFVYSYCASTLCLVGISCAACALCLTVLVAIRTRTWVVGLELEPGCHIYLYFMCVPMQFIVERVGLSKVCSPSINRG